LAQRLRRLARDLGRLLVGAQSEEYRVAHLAPAVHSVNFTSATSFGFTQVVFAASGTFSAIGFLSVINRKPSSPTSTIPGGRRISIFWRAICLTISPT
jgi:hypothetical protein